MEIHIEHIDVPVVINGERTVISVPENEDFHAEYFNYHKLPGDGRIALATPNEGAPDALRSTVLFLVLNVPPGGAKEWWYVSQRLTLSYDCSRQKGVWDPILKCTFENYDDVRVQGSRVTILSH